MMTHFWPHAVQVGDSAAAAGGAGELTALLDDSSDDEVKQQRKLVCRCSLVKVDVQKHQVILLHVTRLCSD